MKHMKRLVAAAPLLFVPLAILACGGDSDDAAGTSNLSLAPGTGVDIRGKIKELQTPGPDVTLGAFLAEGAIEADTRYAKAWVRLKDSTVILRRQGSDTVEATAADLQPGRRVEIKFEGVVAELDPVQATAGEILILE
jgi:hypothetical protein